jgi:hypothetical protein
MSSHRALLFVALVGGSCASSPKPVEGPPPTAAEAARGESTAPLGESPTPIADAPPPSSDTPAAPASAPAPAVAATAGTATTTSGVIARADYERMLSQSPGAFLAHVDPAPTFRDHRFSGWRLNAFFPGDARFAGSGIRVGDIVTRINGRSVEQPDDFSQVWQNARYRRDLTVEILRDGVPRKLSWTIAD